MKDTICNENTGKLTDSKSDQERLVMCDRAFKDAIAPYIEQRVGIYNRCTSITSYWVNGSLKHAHNFNEAEKRILVLIDEQIELKRKEIFNT